MAPVTDLSKPLVLEKGKLIAYQCTNGVPVIRKAGLHREWMERSNQRFVYRCLPLVIANQKGWDIINPRTFHAVWDGTPSVSGIKITWPSKRSHHFVSSHFGEGTLTFSLGYLFRTPPGWNLYATGPMNEPKDGIQCLSGVIETDWSPATFTMNWIFTRPHHSITFEGGESFCRIFPVPRFSEELMDPELHLLDANPELEQEYRSWSAKRDQFNKDLKKPESEAVKQGWQKDYYLGGGSLGVQGVEHQTKLYHREFSDQRPPHVAAYDLLPGDDFRPLQVKLGTPGREKPSTIYLRTIPWERPDVNAKGDPPGPVKQPRIVRESDGGKPNPAKVDTPSSGGGTPNGERDTERSSGDPSPSDGSGLRSPQGPPGETVTETKRVLGNAPEGGRGSPNPGRPAPD